MARNPSLVYGRMTGWGQSGPLSTTSGHDLNYIARSGAAWYGSNPGEPPFTPPTLVGDIGGGAMYLAVGLLAGILKARTSGKGTVVDAAIFDGSAHMLNLLMSLRQTGGVVDARGQSLLDGPHWSRCYETADGGFISVQCLEPKFYACFLECLNLQDDSAFAKQFDKAAWPDLTARLAVLFRSRDRTEWERLFDGTDACVAPVLTPSEAAEQPMSKDRKTWQTVDGALQAAPAPRFSTFPDLEVKPAPKRGQHTGEILDALQAKGTLD